jgi:hypothetical protein
MVAAGSVREGIAGLFDGLVPTEVIEAYDRLLATDGCAKDQANTIVGSAGLVAALTDRGMAHIQPHSPADPAWLRSASPDLALQGVLAGHQARLARDQELLLDGSRRLAAAQARFGPGMNGRFPAHLVSVISDRAEIAELSTSATPLTRNRFWPSHRLPALSAPSLAAVIRRAGPGVPLFRKVAAQRGYAVEWQFISLRLINANFDYANC